MARVKVLVEGYARMVNDEEFASSTVTLVQEKDLNILVDTGMDRQMLLVILFQVMGRCLKLKSSIINNYLKTISG